MSKERDKERKKEERKKEEKESVVVRVRYPA